MILEPRTPNAATDDVRKGQFEAFISPAISGPTLLRPYVWWHSAGSRNWGHYSNPEVDAAFDTIRNARSDDEYARGVASLQRGIIADPPAVFLAWDVKARAVSKRLLVSAEPGVDIMGSLRTWQVNTLTARNGP
jgi:ABC-type transport system substrate-binding protein